MKLGDLRISTRLASAFGLLTLLLVVVALTALRGMSAMAEASDEVATNWLPSVEVLGRMNRGVAIARLSELQHVVAGDANQMKGHERDVEATLATLEQEHAGYAKMIDEGEETRLHAVFASAWTRYLDVHRRVVELSSRNEKDKARALFDGESAKAYGDVVAALDSLLKFNHEGGAAASKQSDRTYATARIALMVVGLVAVLLAAILAWLLVKSITVPLNRAVIAADRVAAGDLSGVIEVDSRDETGQMLDALKRMQRALSETVGSVRNNAESVATASAQIAQGNADLSQRTEEQASSLQQAAASMEQLGSTVKHNADNASQANGLALSASSIASRGGEVVAEVVTTMRGIDESSKRIADIIGVIDGIAFQTNILALNAAVEAARAGEQGRGFAVVASEVRSLAQRSAEAAKEIKSLITSSVDQVQRGTTLVDQAGATMDEIVGSIRRVADIVAEISSASHEQSASVNEVSRAVSQMDQVTQQNAALVEESAAAADGLRGQAQQLVSSVSTFRI